MHQELKKYVRRHRATLLLFFGCLLLFGTMNYMMTQWHEAAWTNPKAGFWSVFYRRFHLSGFDPQTYVVISKWRPLYELYRHPMLSLMMWPLSWVNHVVSEWTGINCAIYVVAVTWTLIDAATFLVFHRLLRQLVGWGYALLLMMMYYSFAYVMLAAIAPDHMILSELLLVITVSAAYRHKNGMAWWKAAVLYLVATGVTLTNGVKIWWADMVGRSWRGMFCRTAVYVALTAIIGMAYYVQTQTTEKDERDAQNKMFEEKLAKDSLFRQQVINDSIKHKKQTEKQIADSKFLKWTDNSIARLPLLFENIFGEGVLLHERHLLEDPNIGEKARPVFVDYDHWWEYVPGACVVVLMLMGVIVGWKEKLLRIVVPMFLFDMLLHVGLRFAASDAYIMTAHWAFVVPISIATLMKNMNKRYKIIICVIIAVLAAYLWWHNATLILRYISQ